MVMISLTALLRQGCKFPASDVTIVDSDPCVNHGTDNASADSDGNVPVSCGCESYRGTDSSVDMGSWW